MIMNNKRFYNFIVIIYEDDDNFKEQYEFLTKEKESIWIRHDQDIDDDGNLKKPHYHFILKLKNAKTISALAKYVNVQENMIEPVKKSFNGALKYLIHYGYDDKFQYDKSLVESNSEKLRRKFDDLVTNDITEVEKVINIQEFIENQSEFIDMPVLGKYVQKINMWDAFRRNYSYFKDLVNSHNGKIAADRYHINEDFYQNLAPNEYPF